MIEPKRGRNQIRCRIWDYRCCLPRFSMVFWIRNYSSFWMASLLLLYFNALMLWSWKWRWMSSLVGVKIRNLTNHHWLEQFVWKQTNQLRYGYRLSSYLSSLLSFIFMKTSWKSIFGLIFISLNQCLKQQISIFKRFYHNWHIQIFFLHLYM